LHFEAQVARHLELSMRKHTTFAVVLMEFDAAGGEAQQTVALMRDALARITQEMRLSEIIARYGESGFAILLQNCNGEQMEAAVTRLLAAAGKAPAGTGLGKAGFRAGGVIAPLHARTLQGLLSFAGEALAMTREQKDTCFVRYEPETARNAANRRLLKAADTIISALNEGRVIIALQPVVDSKTRAVAFYEALVRIRALDGTLIMPDVLVPAAEQGGLVALLDRRVADLSLAYLNANKHLSLSVNASVMSLHDPEWQQYFRAACRLYPAAAGRLIIEITETCAIKDLDATRSVLEMLKELGIKIAIDDFGAGHSSFRNLRELPVDYLKIDGAFAQNLGRSSDDKFFVRTLIDLARNLRIPAVAEWVEDEATAQVLTDWGVDYLQGHLFGKAELVVEIVPLSAVC
jgi:EAL domain-containing protein (putative c-di-GMP-specific phosphodiesterase class I)